MYFRQSLLALEQHESEFRIGVNVATRPLPARTTPAI